MQDRNDVVDRVAAAVPEQRRDLALSLRELERLSGVSRKTIGKVEAGARVQPSLLLQIAATLTVLELYAPPKPPPIDVLDDLVSPLAARRPMLAQAPRRTLGGVA